MATSAIANAGTPCPLCRIAALSEVQLQTENQQTPMLYRLRKVACVPRYKCVSCVPTVLVDQVCTCSRLHCRIAICHTHLHRSSSLLSHSRSHCSVQLRLSKPVHAHRGRPNADWLCCTSQPQSRRHPTTKSQAVAGRTLPLLIGHTVLRARKLPAQLARLHAVDGRIFPDAPGEDGKPARV